MQRSAKFSRIDFEALTFGIAWLYIGFTTERTEDTEISL
jgi:hypothetical protein